MEAIAQELLGSKKVLAKQGNQLKIGRELHFFGVETTLRCLRGEGCWCSVCGRLMKWFGHLAVGRASFPGGVAYGCWQSATAWTNEQQNWTGRLMPTEWTNKKLDFERSGEECNMAIERCGGILF